MLQVPKAVPLRDGEVKSVQVETFRRVQGPNPPVYSYQPAGWYSSRAAQPVYANWQQRSPPSAQRPTLLEHRVQGAAVQSPSLRPQITQAAQVTEQPKVPAPGSLSWEERAAQLLASIFQRPDEPTLVPAVHPARPCEPQLSRTSGGNGRSAPVLQVLPTQVTHIPPASPISARLTQNDRTMTRTASFQPLWTPADAYVATPPTRLPETAPETSSTPSVQAGPPYRRPEVSLEATARMCGASIGDLEATRKQEDVLEDTLPKDLRLDTGATESSPGSSVCSYSSSEAGEVGNPPIENPCAVSNPEPSAVPLPRWVEETPLAPLEIGSPFLFPDSLQSSPLEATQLAAPKSFDFSRLKVQAERIASSK